MIKNQKEGIMKMQIFKRRAKEKMMYQLRKILTYKNLKIMIQHQIIVKTFMMKN